MYKIKIKRHKQIWITEDTYKYLRELKKESVKNKNGKSMTEILDLIIKKHKAL